MLNIIWLCATIICSIGLHTYDCLSLHLLGQSRSHCLISFIIFHLCMSIGYTFGRSACLWSCSLHLLGQSRGHYLLLFIIFIFCIQHFYRSSFLSFIMSHFYLWSFSSFFILSFTILSVLSFIIVVIFHVNHISFLSFSCS